MFSKMADVIMKHSKAVIALWLVVLVCALPFGIKSGDVLEYDMNSMSGSSTEASDGQAIIDEHFSNSIDLSEILVISYSSSEELAAAQAIFVEFQNLMDDKYGAKTTVSNYGTYSKGDPNVEGILMIAIANNEGESWDISHETDNIRDLVKEAKSNASAAYPEAAGLTTYVTGNDAITYDTENSSMEDVSKVDPLSILLIFVLLGLFFYAVVTAVVPPAVVGMAYGIALAAVYAIGCLMGVYYITQTLILVSMLGAGCDYAIFIITRYRDERKKGLSHEDALKTAIMWGGEAVFTSGISVIIGFAALALCDFAMVRTMGIILAIGIAIALVAALTFIPSLLNLVKDKIFWPSNIESYKRVEDKVQNGGKLGVHGHLSKGSKRYFAWLSRNTHKHSKLIAIALVVLCIPGLYIFAESEDSADMISVMPDSESVDGLDLIMTQTDGGTIMPTYIVLEMNESIATVGSLPYGGMSIPYVIWNEHGLNGLDLATMTGAVPTVMKMTKEIDDEYEIVGSISGLNSWQIMYMTVESALGTTDPSTINHVLYEQMPSAVKGYVGMILAIASEQDLTHIDPTAFDKPWNSYVVSGYPLTVANIIDGILNVGTGILSDDGQYVSVMVITTDKPMSADTMDFLAELRSDLHDGKESYDYVHRNIWSASYVAGTSASIDDMSKDIEDQFSMIRIVVAILLIVLLFFILGSYLTPIRSIITILLSVFLTVALTHVVFEGLMDTPVLFLIPIVLFVVLLGLGMDYEIFMTTKIRENKIKGMNNDEAIDNAIKEAGPVISLCALLMGGTFLTLVLANSSMLKELGFALGMGILIDGLLMVGYVSPALMHLMGDWSWKGPGFLTRRHGLNPDGSNMAVPAACGAAPADAERIGGEMPVRAVPATPEEVAKYKQECYSEVAVRQDRIAALNAEVKTLTDNKRIGRLDEEGEKELEAKRSELKAEKESLREFQRKSREDLRSGKGQ